MISKDMKATEFLATILRNVRKTGVISFPTYNFSKMGYKMSDVYRGTGLLQS